MIPAFMARSKLRQIISLMEDERLALLSGPLTKLPEIAEKRTVILEALETGGPVALNVLAGGLAQIRDLAMRNKKLFEASVAGMKSAQETLSEIEYNLGAMATYTAKGKKVPVTQRAPIKDHRV